MRKAGYKMTACGENSDDFHKPPYATFEFHRTLFFDEKDFCPRFDGLWQRATRDPDHPHAFVMDVSDNYLYTVAHMYKHYSTNGCGVRFLADVYLLYTKENARLDRPYIEAEFRKMGILDLPAWYCAWRWICLKTGNWIGTKCKCSPSVCRAVCLETAN